MSRIVVSGGSGFIGTNLVSRLSALGHRVINIDTATPRNAAQNMVWRQQDIVNFADLSSLIGDFEPEYIFHLAARTDLDGKSLQDYSENYEGVRCILEASRNLPNLRRIVLFSTMLVTELGQVPPDDGDYRPSTYYGQSKLIGERIVRDERYANIPWVIVRPTSIWGPWFGVPYRTFFDLIAKGIYVHPRGMTIRRSFGFVYNTTFQVVAIAGADGTDVVHNTFYLADYVPTDLLQWAREIQVAMNAPMIRTVPLLALRLGGWTGDLLTSLGIAAPLTSFRLRNLLTSAIFDTTSLEAICGPLPYDRLAAVRETVDWLRQSG